MHSSIGVEYLTPLPEDVADDEPMTEQNCGMVYRSSPVFGVDRIFLDGFECSIGGVVKLEGGGVGRITSIYYSRGTSAMMCTVRPWHPISKYRSIDRSIRLPSTPADWTRRAYVEDRTTQYGSVVMVVANIIGRVQYCTSCDYFSQYAPGSRELCLLVGITGSRNYAAVPWTPAGNPYERPWFQDDSKYTCSIMLSLF